MARFDWDVAPWKPTVVSVELGLNDGFYTEYRTNMNALVERIKGGGARPVLFTPHPLIDGVYLASIKKGSMKDKVEGNATALGVIATEQGLAFADQFHALMDVWAKNFPIQSAHYAASVARDVLEKQKELPGREHLQQWLDIWSKSEMAASGTDLGIDYVHPGPAGNLTMAAAVLKGLNAPGLVSKATLDATGKVGELIQCQVTNVVVEKHGGISFDRLDTCLPMPIPDNARGGLVVSPAVADLSQWILTVKGLKGGDYLVEMDGANVAKVAANELDKGWNMGLLEKGPVADQCRQILNLVGDKENQVSAWRRNSGILFNNPAVNFGAAETPEKLGQRVLEADARIRAAAQPKSHRFVVAPVKN
jgi:lysophospholipase L1-like esterase